MTDKEKIKIYKDVIIDVLDGNSDWRDIRYNTGLDEERCKEIEEIFYQVLKEK